MARRAIAVWLAILALAVANGALREALLIPHLGRSVGLACSGIALCALILLAARMSAAWIGAGSPKAAWSIGASWVALTLAFEFGSGSLVQHKTWAELLEPYLFHDGNLWPLVLATTLVAPRVWYRRASARG